MNRPAALAFYEADLSAAPTELGDVRLVKPGYFTREDAQQAALEFAKRLHAAGHTERYGVFARHRTGLGWCVFLKDREAEVVQT